MTEDSRCPIDVLCAWAGNAAIELLLSTAGQPADALTLNSTLDPRAARQLGLAQGRADAVDGRG